MTVLLCVALILPMTVLAAETTTTTKSDTTTTTAPVTTKDTDSSTTTSSQKPTTTTTATLQKMATTMTITYEHRVITIRVTDANGKAVAKATVAVSVDGTPSSLTTNSSGVATLTVTSDPMEVRASMAAFQNAQYAYEAAQASVVLQTMPSTVSTTAPTTPTSENTTTSTKVNTTPFASGRPLTTTDPAEGDVTQVVTVTGTTTPSSNVSEEEKEPAVRLAAGKLAWVLIVLGVVLVLAAIAILVVFLVRRPHDPDEEDETEMGSEEGMADYEDPEAEEAYETSEDDPATDAEETKGTGVSLEDLFRK